MDSIISRLKEFMENEVRSGSMDLTLSKSISEPTVGVVTIPDAPSFQPAPKSKDYSIRDLNVRLANGTYKS